MKGARLPVNAVKVAPGFYEVPIEGDLPMLYIDAQELCREVGWPPTRENQLRIAKLAQECGQEQDKLVQLREKIGPWTG